MPNVTKPNNNIGTIYEPVYDPEIEIMLSQETTIIEDIVHLGTRITMGLTHSIINEKPKRVLKEDDRKLAREEIVKAVREGSLEGPFELALNSNGEPEMYGYDSVGNKIGALAWVDYFSLSQAGKRVRHMGTKKDRFICNPQDQNIVCADFEYSGNPILDFAVMPHEDDELFYFDLKSMYKAYGRPKCLRKYFCWADPDCPVTFYRSACLWWGESFATEIIRPTQEGIKRGIEERTGLKVSYWVDDFTVRGNAYEAALMDVETVIREEVTRHGHLINEEKSSLEGCKSAKVCGVILDLDHKSLRIDEEKTTRLMAMMRSVSQGKCSFKEARCWSGFVVHCASVLRGSSSLLQPFWKALYKEKPWAVTKQMRESAKHILKLCEDSMEDNMITRRYMRCDDKILRFHDKKIEGNAVGEGTNLLYCLTDASNAGYGLVTLNGLSDPTIRMIECTVDEDGLEWANHRELNGLYLWMMAEKEALRGKRVLWLCDNMTAVSDVNKRNPRGEDADVRRKTLSSITQIEDRLGCRVAAQWLPGALATLADDGSRVSDLKETRWSVEEEVFVGWPLRKGMLVSEHWLPYLRTFTTLQLHYKQTNVRYYKDGVGEDYAEGAFYVLDRYRLKLE